MAEHPHEDVRRLFDMAMDVPASQRETVLDRECGGHEGLKQRILAMIAAAEDDQFLGNATGGDLDEATVHSLPERAPDTSTHESVGQRIDRYKLLEKIGEGGFGTVWAAEQREPVKRRVALKIIKLGMDTKQVIARFEAERQALAMMDHPNIARVLDAGATETGRPYFVMELVKGVPILEYCDQEKLDIRARLGLFTLVCNAIQHAHQKGIVHRDIKPSNVLVTMHDGVPVPKVIDFGIAKATNAELTEKTIYTEHRQMIGTPAYMSPEQAEMSGLDIDTRSDIYSLGVLLYEMLTGTTPFTQDELMAAGFEGMMRMIRETEPQKPSTRVSTLGQTATRSAQQRRSDVHKLSHTVRGDLDWIVMKCLEKDRTRRYETASGLAADIVRNLDDEPVLAGPPRATYRLAKFVRRNRRGVVAGCAIMLAITLGLAGMTWMFLQAESARRQTAEQYRQAELARESAAALNDYFFRVFGEIGWTSSGADEYPPAQEMSAGEFVMRAIDLVDEGLDGYPLLEAEVRISLDSALFPFDTYNPRGGDRSLILSLYEEAGLPADHPDVLHGQIMNIIPASGIVTPDANTLATAIEYLEQLEVVAGRCDPRTRESMGTIAQSLHALGRSQDAYHLMTPYRELDCDPPESASGRTRIALEDVAYGLILASVEQFAGAEAYYLELLERSSDEMPDLARGWTYIILASIRSRIGRAGEESGLYLQGLELYHRTLGPDHSFSVKWEMDAANILLFDGRPNEAERKARAIADRVAELFPSPISPVRLLSAFRLTWTLLFVGKSEEAARILATATPDTRARALFERLALHLPSLDAASLRVGGDAEAVLRLAVPALEAFEAEPFPTERAIAGALLQREIAYAEAMLGNIEASRTGFERAREMAIDAFGPDTPWRRWIDLDLAKLDAGGLDTNTYLQNGWIEHVTKRR